MTETRRQTKDRTARILEELEKAYPHAGIQLTFTNPLELLVATILAAQCTDERVNRTTKDVFKRYTAARDYAEAPLDELQEIFRPTGFYKNKSKSVQKVCRALVDQYGGEVPDDRDKLAALPGVGRKTANVVVANAYDKPAIIVDTHVIRVSGRLQLASEHYVAKKNADRIEEELNELVPKEKWTRFSHLISQHGRETCKARKPRCPECRVLSLCPYLDKTEKL